MWQRVIVALLLLAPAQGTIESNTSMADPDLERDPVILFGMTLPAIEGSAAFFVIGLSVLLLSRVCRQHPTQFDEGLLSNPAIWHDRKCLTKVVKEKAEGQGRMDVRYSSIMMNRPWRKDGVGLLWGGDAPISSSNAEWMGHEAFPCGEENTDNRRAMILAFWKFMFRWKRHGAIYSGSIKFFIGLLAPFEAQVLAQMLAEIETGGDTRSETGIFKHVPGTPKRILFLYCALYICIRAVEHSMVWKFNMEVPEGGAKREIKLRMQRKFLAMHPETAKFWPETRASAVLEHDVDMAIGLWALIFSIIGAVGTTLGVFIVTFSESANLNALMAWLPMLVGLFVFSFLDFQMREPFIRDLAERTRQWFITERTLSTLQIQHVRAGHQDDTDDADFFNTSLVAFYRAGHSYFVGLGAERVGNMYINLCLGVVYLVGGIEVMNKTMTFSEVAALVLTIRVLATVQKELLTDLRKTAQGVHSLIMVATVLNVDEAFDDSDSDSLLSRASSRRSLAMSFQSTSVEL